MKHINEFSNFYIPAMPLLFMVFAANLECSELFSKLEKSISKEEQRGLILKLGEIECHDAYEELHNYCKDRGLRYSAMLAMSMIDYKRTWGIILNHIRIEEEKTARDRHADIISRVTKRKVDSAGPDIFTAEVINILSIESLSDSQLRTIYRGINQGLRLTGTICRDEYMSKIMHPESYPELIII